MVRTTASSVRAKARVWGRCVGLWVGFVGVVMGPPCGLDWPADSGELGVWGGARVWEVVDCGLFVEMKNCGALGWIVMVGGIVGVVDWWWMGGRGP